MTPVRRIALIGLGIVSALLLVAFAALLSLPLWIDSNAVKSKVAALVHQATGAMVQIDHLQLHLFPPVSVEISGPRYTISGGTEIAAEAVAIDLDFLPLLSGYVQPRGIRFTGLQATIHLPPASANPTPLSLAALDRQLREVLVQVAKAVPALHIAADNAAVTIVNPGQPPFALRMGRLRASTSDGRVEGELVCASDAWQWLALNFSVKGNDLTGTGTAEFTGLHVERLRGLIGSSADWPVTQAELLGRIEWQMSGLANVRAEAIASSSRIVLQRNNAVQSLDGVAVAAGLETRGAALDLHLRRLYVDAPHMLLSGNLRDDGRGHQQFDAQASGTDLVALQAAARNLAPDVQWIAKPPVTLSAGALTALELHSSAESIAQLFDPAMLAGEAAFAGVAIDVAKPAIRLSAVEGRVTLDQGVLRGKNITAALGKSVLRGGTMAMNLLGNPITLKADAVVALDLAEALALAKKVVTQKEALRQLRAVEKLDGSALARIVLAGDFDSLQASVEASGLALSLRHRDLPLPLHLSSGQVAYTGNAITMNGVTGAFGRSGFKDLGASLALAAPYRFEFTRGSASLLLDDLFPLATARPELANALAELQSISGEIAVSNVQAAGSVQKPEAMHFRADLSPRSVKVQTKRFAVPILFDGGAVEVSERRIEARDIAVSVLDSALHVSGRTGDYRTGITAADATMNGEIGAQTLDRIYQIAETPRAYQVRAPLRFSDAAAAWKDSGEITLKAKVSVADGTDLSIDARKTANILHFERVSLKDAATDASFGGELAGKQVKAWFSGKLAGEAIKHVFIEPALSIGSLEGDMVMDINLDRPAEMRAKGRLQGKAITTAGEFAIPIGIEQLALTADGTKFTFDGTLLSNIGNRVQLGGSVYHQGKQFIVDADVRADRIVLPKSLTESRDGKENKGNGEPRPKLDIADFPVAGRVGVNIRSLEADGMEISPLIAVAKITGARLDLRIADAALCGITMSGSLAGETGDLELDGTLSVRNADVAKSIACVTRDRIEASGHIDVDAHFTSRGSIDALLERLGGSFSVNARNGNIQKFDTLNRVFAVLNVTEIVRGKRPALNEKGMPYNYANAKGRLQRKAIYFDEFILDAPTVHLIATGKVDYGDGKMALDVMVAPLQTANAIVDKIPVVGRIFGGAVLALPVKVAGTIQHPIVVPLGPGAIATRMTSIIANTLKLPFDAVKVFSPNAEQGAKTPAAEK